MQWHQRQWFHSSTPLVNSILLICGSSQVIVIGKVYSHINSCQHVDLVFVILSESMTAITAIPVCGCKRHSTDCSPWFLLDIAQPKLQYMHADDRMRCSPFFLQDNAKPQFLRADIHVGLCR